MNRTAKLKSSSSELDLDRPNIEDYLPSGSSVQHERQGKLRLLNKRAPCGFSYMHMDSFIIRLSSILSTLTRGCPMIFSRSTKLIMLAATTSFCGRLLQSTILESVGCIWFNSTEAKDEKLLREHVQGANNNPLLIFPEETCVNNHYTVMFKKFAQLHFVDAFWNSRQQSFTTHLLQLMTSWAVVCDVWYLEPQNLKPGETSIEFAERHNLTSCAGLQKAPWDGYLKYSRPCPKHRESK
ncbi:hypothetical protein PHAVU_002G192000 [Phaseolus vulgaris]|uniref:Phospholipid/glycerol acyltransferase domain-containing protein n=1 Tax=Phaseolus vulgaris TaxID=3885 RepID=V7CNT5_PHAVU|nr:hypothetical protein PHAVU_002G192000g [Phaseolus vulgaris]ESW30905.1 hypothetical protein PHAVU_002G192000g [Phaseolus vulgaris]